MQTRIEVFRAGTHRAENGQTYTFSEADVAAIAAAYDPALHQVPGVLGHPKTDDPAWMWAESFEAVDGRLFANLHQINPAFAEGVDAGSYKHRSLAFYAPTDAGNPKPGAWYPRHIGWLGARAPAIKGLETNFAAGDDAFVAFSAQAETGWGLRQAAQAFRSIRDWIIGKYGQEEADRVLPQWTDQGIAESAATIIDEADKARPAFSEPSVIEPDEAAALAARAAELDAREAAIFGREAQAQAQAVAFAEAARAEQRGEDVGFVDELVAAGRLPPGHRDGCIALFAHAGGDTTVQFSEADDARAQLRGLLSGLGVSINFSEAAAPDGFTGTVDAGVLASRAQQLVSEAQARGETLSYAVAVGRAKAL